MTTVAKDVVFKVRFDFEAAKKQLERENANQAGKPGPGSSSRSSRISGTQTGRAVKGGVSAATAAGLAALGAVGGARYGIYKGIEWARVGNVMGVDAPISPMVTSPAVKKMYDSYRKAMGKPSYTPVTPGLSRLGGSVSKAAGSTVAASAARFAAAAAAKSIWNIPITDAIGKLPGAVGTATKAAWGIGKWAAPAYIAKTMYDAAPAWEAFAFRGGYGIAEGVKESIRLGLQGPMRIFNSMSSGLEYQSAVYKMGRGRTQNVGLLLNDPVEATAWNFSELEKARDRAFTRRVAIAYGKRLEAEMTNKMDDTPIPRVINWVTKTWKQWF